MCKMVHNNPTKTWWVWHFLYYIYPIRMRAQRELAARRLVLHDAKGALEAAPPHARDAAATALSKAKARLYTLTRTSTRTAAQAKPHLGEYAKSMQSLFRNRHRHRARTIYLSICALLDETSACVWNTQIDYPSPQSGAFVDVTDAYSHLPFRPLKVVSITSEEMTVRLNSNMSADGNVVHLRPYAAIRDGTSGEVVINFHLLERFYPDLHTRVLNLLSTPISDIATSSLHEVEPVAGGALASLPVVCAHIRLRRPTDPRTPYRLVREVRLIDDANLYTICNGELFTCGGQPVGEAVCRAEEEAEEEAEEAEEAEENDDGGRGWEDEREDEREEAEEWGDWGEWA